MHNIYQSPRIGFLDGFRFLLAFWVFSAHYYTLIGGTKYFSLPGFLLETFNKPVNAVNGFMIITGFLMTYNYIERRVAEPFKSGKTHTKFWLRRFFRLYPVYLIAVVVAFIFYVPLAKLNAENLVYFTGSNLSQWGTVRSIAQPTVPDLVSHIFLIHGLIPQYYDSILGVTWSLSLEAQFYALFPFIFLILFSNSRRQRNTLVVGTVILLVASIAVPRVVNYIGALNGMPAFTLPSYLLCAMPLFLIGMISAAVKLRQLHLTYLLIALAVILPFQSKTTLLIAFAILVLLFLDELKYIIPGAVFRIFDALRTGLSSRPAIFASDISYSFYLTHTMVIGGVLQLLIHTFPGFSRIEIALSGFILSALVCAVISQLLFIYVEKPFIDIGRKIVKRGASKALVPDTVTG